MIAFAAPSASAVEVSAEGGAHCPEVKVDNDHDVTGGCLIEAETVQGNPVTFANHFHMIGEVIFTNCDNTFEARIHESDDGWMFNQVFTLMEFGPSTVPANEAIQFTFCLRGAGEEGSSFGTCTIFVPMVAVAPHTYRFVTIAPGPSEPNPPPAGLLQSRCSQNAATSFTGQWQIHGTPIEITH